MTYHPSLGERLPRATRAELARLHVEAVTACILCAHPYASHVRDSDSLDAKTRCSALVYTPRTGPVPCDCPTYTSPQGVAIQGVSKGPSRA